MPIKDYNPTTEGTIEKDSVSGLIKRVTDGIIRLPGKPLELSAGERQRVTYFLVENEDHIFDIAIPKIFTEEEKKKFLGKSTIHEDVYEYGPIHQGLQHLGITCKHTIYLDNDQPVEYKSKLHRFLEQ